MLELTTSKNYLRQGQSLVEVVVAIFVVTLVLTALLSAITVSLANAQFSRNKTLATKYADEAVEWLRNQRDTLGWTDFSAKSDATYCLDSTPSWGDGDTCTTKLDNLYTRTATLTSGTDKVTIQVVVSWTQGTRPVDVQVDTILTRWK